MNSNLDGWGTRYEREISAARDARQRGNEGMARVCARRAAGIAVGEYFHRRQIAFDRPSAYDRLRFLEVLPDVPVEVHAAAGRLLMRITPDHTLPIEADLIADAEWLAEELLKP
jgi:hypothetical protein